MKRNVGLDIFSQAARAICTDDRAHVAALQEQAWRTLARDLGWPLHRADREVDAPSLVRKPGSWPQAFYALHRADRAVDADSLVGGAA